MLVEPGDVEGEPHLGHPDRMTARRVPQEQQAVVRDAHPVREAARSRVALVVGESENAQAVIPRGADRQDLAADAVELPDKNPINLMAAGAFQNSLVAETAVLVATEHVRLDDRDRAAKRCGDGIERLKLRFGRRLERT